MQTKKCTKCERELPATLEYFHAKQTGKFGIFAVCKSCRVIEKKIYTEKNKARIKDVNSQYYLRNRNDILRKTSQYKKDNVEIVRKYSRRLGSKRRALEKNNGYNKYTEDQIFELYGTNCYLCDMPINLNAPRKTGVPGWRSGLQIEHFVDIAKGGPDTLENVRPSHGWCNLTKER
jgi:hypothetical protein